MLVVTATSANQWGGACLLGYRILLRSAPLPFDGNNKANQESGELFTGLSGAN